MDNNKISEDIAELKMLITKQEFSISTIMATLDRLTDSVVMHVKRSDAIESLVKMLTEELGNLRTEHDLARTLLVARIDAEKVSTDNKSELLWTVLRTVLYTLSSVGAVLLALHELGILDKILK